MTKKRIFLIIGLIKESSHWDDNFISSLKDYFKTDEIVGIDLPGAGKLSHLNSPPSIEQMVRLSRENFKDEFIEDRENILISVSLGGMVATKWLELFPNDFKKFVIVNSSFKGMSPLTKRVQPWAIKQFLKIFATSDISNREERIIKLCSNNDKRYDITHKKWVKIAHERPMTRRNMVMQTLAGARFKATYKPSIPTLIIAAEHDKLAHYSCSKRLHDSWGGDFHLFSERHLGHAIHVDAPKDLAAVISKWAS